MALDSVHLYDRMAHHGESDMSSYNGLAMSEAENSALSRTLTQAPSVRTQRCALLVLAVIGLGAPTAIAIADEVPNLNVSRTCRTEEKEAKTDGTMGTAGMAASCMTDEQQARDTLKQKWAKFSSAEKTRCVQASVSNVLPSYVELLTCLEMEADAKELRERK